MTRDAAASARTLYGRMPRALRGVVAAAAVALGAVLIVRPTMTLGLLALLIGAGLVLAGILELGERDADADRPRWRALMAMLWLAGGLGVLLLPGLTVRIVALVVGLLLVVGGALSLLAAFRTARTADARVADAAFGVAGIVFGVLALAWPDITLLVVAIVFGARLIIGGLVELWRAVRGSPGGGPDRRDAGAAPRRRRWTRTIGALGAVAIAVAAGAVSAALHDGSPVVDDFYAAPLDVPAAPGALLRAEPFARGVPDGAHGWRILYTTTDGDGAARVASGLVVVPDAGDGNWPVIDWTHGTTGAARQCAPSLQEEPFESGALFALPQIIDSGWALVATDYIGLGTEGPHPYLIGPPTAHASLDAVRAARQLTEARLGERTVVWGHSQGGGGALWTGALADAYAPDIPLSGVVALAPAGDPPALVAHLPNVTGGSIFASFAVSAYTAIYDDVDYHEYIRPGAEPIVRAMAGRCLAEPGTLVSLLEALGLSRDPEIFSTDPTAGALGARLAENVAPPTVTAPLLIGQGGADRLVPSASQRAFVEGLCAAGQRVEYVEYAGLDHIPLIASDSPAIADVVEWTKARLAGDPVDDDCTTTEVPAG